MLEGILHCFGRGLGIGLERFFGIVFELEGNLDCFVRYLGWFWRDFGISEEILAYI